MFVQKFDNIDGESILNKTLKTIELNLFSSCNRKCSFCPQSFGFNRKDSMSLTNLISIADKIKTSGYSNQITLSGYGEPTLHKHFDSILIELRKRLNNQIRVHTNGDHLAKHIDTILNQNIVIRLSKYDKYAPIIKIMEEKGVTFEVRDYYSKFENNQFNNRSMDLKIYKGPCYIPAYKLFIDFDGNIRPCSHNWKSPSLPFNLMEDDLENIWFNSLDEFRNNNSKCRSKNTYCMNCSVKGTLYGETELNILRGENA